MGIRALVQKTANRVGYDIVRHSDPVHSPFDVLGLLIRDVLPRTPSFTFVQIGANDGASHDPLRPSILRHQLPGLLVEPLPHPFERLKQNYAGQPGLTFENCAIADEDGAVTLYRIRPDAPLPQDAQNIASFDRRNLTTARQGIPGLDAYIEEVRVPALTLTSLLEKHGLAPPTLLLVDTEGFDGHIVRGALRERLRPSIIMYEHAWLLPAEQHACLLELKAAGYEFLSAGIDTYAVRRP